MSGVSPEMPTEAGFTTLTDLYMSGVYLVTSFHSLKDNSCGSLQVGTGVHKGWGGVHMR